MLWPMIPFSMLHASVITAAEKIWRMWCVRKEVGQLVRNTTDWTGYAMSPLAATPGKLCGGL